MTIRLFFIVAINFCFLIKNNAQNKETKIIHVLVALCDNKNQGIVPTTPQLGNGQNPTSNLYWGALYGVKTHFKKNTEWKLIKSDKKINDHILERCVFQHSTHNAILVADAYDGKYIRQTTEDFLEELAGEHSNIISINNKSIDIAQNSELVVYVGHNGLMDFDLDFYPKNKGANCKSAIILACYSKKYFYEPLQNTKSEPLLWTTHLMSPEAYTLEAAIGAWLQQKNNTQIREMAAKAYHRYQKCGLNAAKNLLVTDW